MRVRVQERLGSHDLARRANPALEAAILDKGLLQGVQAIALRQPFDGGDRAAVRHDSQGDAGTHWLSVQQHRAGAAHAHTAALFRSGEAQVVAQKIDQQAVVRNLTNHRLAVHPQPYRSHCLPSFARSPAYTLSAVMGNSVSRTPTAAKTALAMAAGTATLLSSPTALPA